MSKMRNTGIFDDIRPGHVPLNFQSLKVVSRYRDPQL